MTYVVERSVVGCITPKWALNVQPCGQCQQFKKVAAARFLGICTQRCMVVLANEVMGAPDDKPCFTQRTDGNAAD